MSEKFIEQQKFTQWWVWAIIVIVGFPFMFGLYHQVYQGIPLGDNPMSDAGLISSSALYLLLLVFLISLKLTTEITTESLKFYFFPFVKRQFEWTEIKKTEVLNYGFVGGWGIRFGTKYGTVYNIKGNKGLAVELNNGKRFLIGTQKPEELNRFLKKNNRL